MKQGKATLVACLVLASLAMLLAACGPATPAAPTAAGPAATPPVKAVEPTKAPGPTPSPPPSPTSTPKPVTLKFGGLPSTANSGVYVASDKGYFMEQGITTEVVSFNTVAELIAPLGVGQLDIIGLPLSVPLLAAADRGIELKIAAGGSLNVPGFDNSWILLRKDLKDSGQVKSPADLKGMKVAIPSLGSLGEQTMQLTLQQGGLTPKDVDMVVLPFGDQPAGFANKAIAAAFSNEPNLALAVQQGFAVKWLPASQFFGGKAQGTVIVFGSTLLKDQELARRWVIAYIKGSRDYLKAFTKQEGRAQVVDILVKYTPIKDPKLYDVMEMPYMDPNGMPDKKSIDAQYKWFVDKGVYTGKKTFDDIMDIAYADYASGKLGKQ